MTDVEIGVFPPALFLADVVDALTGSNIIAGAQDMHFEEEGAFTGEVSARMILSVGGTHVILGHSERRHVFGEGDEYINKKMRAAHKFGLLPILCVGEQLEQRKTDPQAEDDRASEPQVATRDDMAGYGFPVDEETVEE